MRAFPCLIQLVGKVMLLYFWPILDFPNDCEHVTRDHWHSQKFSEVLLEYSARRSISVASWYRQLNKSDWMQAATTGVSDESFSWNAVSHDNRLNVSTFEKTMQSGPESVLVDSASPVPPEPVFRLCNRSNLSLWAHWCFFTFLLLGGRGRSENWEISFRPRFFSQMS